MDGFNSDADRREGCTHNRRPKAAQKAAFNSSMSRPAGLNSKGNPHFLSFLCGIDRAKSFGNASDPLRQTWTIIHLDPREYPGEILARIPTLIPAFTNESFRTAAPFQRRNKRPKNERETPAGFS